MLLRQSIVVSSVVLSACWGQVVHGQVFVNASAQIPATGSSTENVDFADVDQDGDWDAALADGGDAGDDQNRLYVNKGGLQAGTLGFFQDDTATHLPVVADDSRDIEFVDFDGDGDVDLYAANTAQLFNQSSRWWTNLGGQQGGTPGFYADETSTRWVGLGGPGSSLAPSQVLASGGFVDWSCDADFGDLDGDGDLDLFHSSYGGAFGGQVPSRVFMNDGDGHFEEFNPSGFQLAGSGIAPGNPGLWCEGTQIPNTTNVSGAQCDVASSALDIDPMDLDGDLDIDILHGAREEAPRIFQNRLSENEAFLGFRDVTGTAWPAPYYSGGDNYAEELGDMDHDGDVDALGVNYPGLSEAVYNNIGTPGSIVFNNMQSLGSSSNDDNEGDFLDYDGDGDLDIFIAAFFGLNHLYNNGYAGGPPGSFSYTFVIGSQSGLTFSQRSLDADAADVDQDGDPDVMTAEDAGQNEVLLKNVLRSGDSHAPYVPRVEALGAATAFYNENPVRAQVYDNAPYFTTWYDTTYLEIMVNGFHLPNAPMRSMGGQIFRGAIAGNLLGLVNYAVHAIDEHGNAGVSSRQTYSASCCDDCPFTFGQGAPGGAGTPSLSALSQPFAGMNLYLGLSGVLANAPYLVAVASAALPSPLDLPGLTKLNVLGTIYLTLSGLADANGKAVIGLSLPSTLTNGTVYLQAFALDGTAGYLYSSSPGLGLVLQPDVSISMCKGCDACDSVTYDPNLLPLDADLIVSDKNCVKEGGVANVDELVQKICGSFPGIEHQITVCLDGHGAEGIISVGAGKNGPFDDSTDLKKANCLTKKNAKAFHDKIKDKVSKITLFGCSVGATQEGQDFLDEMASGELEAKAYDKSVCVMYKDQKTVIKKKTEMGATLKSGS